MQGETDRHIIENGILTAERYLRLHQPLGFMDEVIRPHRARITILKEYKIET